MPVEKDKCILSLADGRQLGYAVFGNGSGPPVFYMHGFYGSRIEARLAAGAAERCGIQLIAADRPGVGETSPEPGRSLESWGAHIAALADHLGHQRFHILGVSGGGPYALATARYLKDRITGIALCCSLAPLTDTSTLPSKYRIALWAEQSFNPMLKLANRCLYTGARMFPRLLLKTIRSQLSSADKKTLSEPSTSKILITSLTEASRQGPLYGEEELTIFGSDWTYLFNDFSLPLDIWHGDADKVVPVAMAHQLQANLPQSSIHIVPGEGHFSLPIRHADKIFQKLLRSGAD